MLYYELSVSFVYGTGNITILSVNVMLGIIVSIVRVTSILNQYLQNLCEQFPASFVSERH